MVHVNETIVMFLYVLSKHQSNTRPLALFPPIFSIILIFFPSDLHFSKNNRTFALEDAIDIVYATSQILGISQLLFVLEGDIPDLKFPLEQIV